MNPWIEVTLAGDADISGIGVLGNRQSAAGFDFFAGRFAAYDAIGNLIYESPVLELPSPDRDVLHEPGLLTGVRRVRFTPTADESCEPGLAEFNLLGEFDDPSLGGHFDGTRPGGSVFPLTGAVDVPPGVEMRFDLSERLNPLTVIPGSTLLLRREPGFAPVAFDFSLSDDLVPTLTVTPQTPLDAETTYRLDLSTGAEDLAGNRCVGIQSRFTTAAGAGDNDAPELVSISPLDGSQGVLFNQQFVLGFTESLDPATLNANNIIFFVNGVRRNPSITRSADNRTLLLSGLGSGDAGKEVSVVVTSAVTDLSGNALADFEARYTLANPVDGTRPTPGAFRPGNGATGVDPLLPIVVLVNEALEADSIEGNVRVTENGELVDGAVELTNAGKALVFRPDSPFGFGSLVETFVRGGLRDASGNRLNQEISFFYTTRQDPTTLEPTVVDLQPVSQFPVNGTIKARFSEPMDPATLTPATLLVQNISLGGSPSVAGTRSLSADGLVFCFAPDAPFTAGHRIRLTFTRALLDATGTALAAQLIRDVFPSIEEDTEVSAAWLSPADGSEGVGVDASLRVRLDEPCSPLTANDSTLSLRTAAGDRVPCRIVLENSNRLVRFIPHELLEPETLHTFEIDGLTDLAGNLVPAASVTFRSADCPDLVRPTLVRSSPASNVLVPRNAKVGFLLSEEMDIHSFAFYLENATTRERVPSVLEFSAEDRRAVISATELLEADTRYTAFLGSGEDLTGLILGNRAFSFTTDSTVASTPLGLLGTDPAATAADVPLNGRITLDFGRVIDITSAHERSISLLRGGQEVPLGISFLPGNRGLLLSPEQLLEPGSHRLRLSAIGGLCDLGGQGLATDFDLDFSVIAATDLIRPAVLVVNPENGSTGVSRVVTVVLDLSESINPLSVVAGIDGVESTVTLNAANTRITITPDAQLNANQSYRVRADFTDTAGNIDTFGSSSFTTGD